MFNLLSFQEFISAFLVMFAVISIVSSIPVIIDLKKKGKSINPQKIAISSFLLFIGFFYVGEMFLRIFGLDLSSFAIAGSLIIFMLAMEMILNVEIFHEKKEATQHTAAIPLVFPLIAGAGSLTTLLTLRSQYADINILLAVLMNMVIVFFVVKLATLISKKLGVNGIYILQKCSGIILLTISVKIFLTNVAIVFMNN